MITEDYVSFEIAKLLKEKGFNERCVCYYDTESLNKFGHPVFDSIDMPLSNSDLEQSEHNYVCHSAPTLQMAMKWLREVHHCVICITPLTFYCGEVVSKWGYCIWADDNTEVDEESSPRLESYEEACEAAIKYCLENLI